MKCSVHGDEGECFVVLHALLDALLCPSSLVVINFLDLSCLGRLNSHDARH